MKAYAPLSLALFSALILSEPNLPVTTAAPPSPKPNGAEACNRSERRIAAAKGKRARRNAKRAAIAARNGARA